MLFCNKNEDTFKIFIDCLFVNWQKKKVQLNSFSSFLTGLSESKDWSVYRAADAIPSRVPAAAPDSGLSQR